MRLEHLFEFAAHDAPAAGRGRVTVVFGEELGDLLGALLLLLEFVDDQVYLEFGQVLIHP